MGTGRYLVFQFTSSTKNIFVALEKCNWLLYRGVPLEPFCQLLRFFWRVG